MSWRCQQVHEKPLPPARSEEAYALHRAALEWGLVEPIVLSSAEDIKSKLNWRDRLEPYEHQVRNLFTFCRRLPVTLIADDVGLGKTISAGLILSELMSRRRVRRALVLCPKILAPQWVEELESKFGIPARSGFGDDFLEAVRASGPVVITTYDTARSRLAAVPPGTFEMLILDEAHKVRNLHGNKRPPEMAVRVHKALEDRLFRYVLMLTATPIQNRLWDLYSLIDCLTTARGHSNPLGATAKFRERYIEPGSDGRRLRPERAEEFRGILRDYLVRTRRGDAQLKFPDRQVEVFRVPLTPGEQQLYAVVGQHIESLRPLQQISLAQALMSSPRALAAQADNMARNGTLPEAAAAEIAAIARALPEPAKLERLVAFLDELRRQRPVGWRAAVFTLRKETQDTIGEALERRGIPYGFIRGACARQNQRSIERFRKEPPEANVIVSTDAGAEGINLQVANVLVNYDLPWNPMVVEQRIGRVQRLASTHEYVVVGNLVSAGSVEERVVARLMEKLQTIAHAIGDIEAILESAGWDDDEGEGSFEQQIRELVVKSLVGQDVREATEQARESIDRAWQYLEERLVEMDETLGRLDKVHESGPSMPALARTEPGLPARDFVLRARQLEGATIEPINGAVYRIEHKGRAAEIITFNEAANGDRPDVPNDDKATLYLPGQPSFERLTQHWMEHAAQRVWDLCPHSPERAEEMGRAWCAGVRGAVFAKVEFQPTATHFQGSAVIKVRAGNALDGYEKLLQRQLIPERHAVVNPPADAPLVEGDLLPSRLLPAFDETVAGIVEADPDVGQFCGFYEARLKEEIDRAGKGPRRLHKLETDLTPQVFAEVVGLHGARYDAGQLTVHFTVEDHPYEAALDVVPVSGQILAEPERRACALTGLVVPETCLASCAVSGTVALKHRLVVSETSGRYALPEHQVVCPVSGQRVLSDEMARSAITGRLAAAVLFRPSAISGRLGLPEDFARCQITAAEVLRDELAPSQVSGRLFRQDESAVSAVSGTVGHRSEFVTCEATGQPILPSEAARSDLSGRRVRKDILKPSEKYPSRCGLEDEFVVCQASGKRLLRDEAAASAVSSQWYDRDLLRPSARSGRLAHPSEMVVCEATGAPLLPLETDVCTATGKRVDVRRLAASQASGALALADQFVTCAKTGKRVLPSELAVCEFTGLRVLPGELEVCAVTGRRVLRERLLKSSVSDRYVLPEHAVRSALSGAVALPDEMVTCNWLEVPILKQESGVCKLTGCTVAKNVLNAAGELAPLRALLEGRARTPVPARELVPWLRGQAGGAFRGLKQLWRHTSPSGGVAAVCGEVRTFLGFRVRYLGAIVRIRGEFAILGRHVLGRRGPEGWVVESSG
jgi:superfamily II DNA or RNA helicase